MKYKYLLWIEILILFSLGLSFVSVSLVRGECVGGELYPQWGIRSTSCACEWTTGQNECVPFNGDNVSCENRWEHWFELGDYGELYEYGLQCFWNSDSEKGPEGCYGSLGWGNDEIAGGWHIEVKECTPRCMYIDGMYVDPDSRGLCGEKCYDTVSQTCCSHNNNYKIFNGFLLSCCGLETFNPKKEKCCKENVVTPYVIPRYEGLVFKTENSCCEEIGSCSARTTCGVEDDTANKAVYWCFREIMSQKSKSFCEKEFCNVDYCTKKFVGKSWNTNPPGFHVTPVKSGANCGYSISGSGFKESGLAGDVLDSIDPTYDKIFDKKIWTDAASKCPEGCYPSISIDADVDLTETEDGWNVDITASYTGTCVAVKKPPKSWIATGDLTWKYTCVK